MRPIHGCPENFRDSHGHGYYSQHFSWAFVPIDPVNVPTKLEVHCFTRSWDNRGYPKMLPLCGEIKIIKNTGSPWIRWRSLFFQNFNGLLFGWVLMYPLNLKSTALPVPEIIWGTQKIWAVPGYAHAPLSAKFLMGFYSDWPCKCTRQVRSFTCSWDKRG